MTENTLYTLVGIALFFIGLYGVIERRHLLQKIISINIMGSGVFLVIVSLAYVRQTSTGDPLSHALVITGLVVSVSATALALKLICHYYKQTGATHLPEDQLTDAK
jgi:multicomponent Na+:H+ antiporter subunit C